MNEHNSDCVVKATSYITQATTHIMQVLMRGRINKNTRSVIVNLLHEAADAIDRMGVEE